MIGEKVVVVVVTVAGAGLIVALTSLVAVALR